MRYPASGFAYFVSHSPTTVGLNSSVARDASSPFDGVAILRTPTRGLTANVVGRIVESACIVLMHRMCHFVGVVGICSRSTTKPSRGLLDLLRLLVSLQSEDNHPVEVGTMPQHYQTLDEARGHSPRQFNAHEMLERLRVSAVVFLNLFYVLLFSFTFAFALISKQPLPLVLT